MEENLGFSLEEFMELLGTITEETRREPAVLHIEANEVLTLRGCLANRHEQATDNAMRKLLDSDPAEVNIALSYVDILNFVIAALDQRKRFHQPVSVNLEEAEQGSQIATIVLMSEICAHMREIREKIIPATEEYCKTLSRVYKKVVTLFFRKVPFAHFGNNETKSSGTEGA
ncbi:MAG: hypothetical protein ACOX8W_06705 [bacterium]|jgi:hypothetical protein